jgi:hypothetical protein
MVRDLADALVLINVFDPPDSRERILGVEDERADVALIETGIKRRRSHAHPSATCSHLHTSLELRRCRMNGAWREAKARSYSSRSAGQA